jgi:hypothetical protein
VADGAELEGNPKVEIEPRGLDDATAERFVGSARSSVHTFSGLARMYGVELPELVLIGTLDFRGTVDAILKDVHGAETPDYTTERLAGTAIGKNIPLIQDHSKVAVVMLAHGWSPAAGEVGLAGGHYFLAHELTHAVLDRLRVASGALAGVTFPSQTPVAAARSIIRCAVDEARADKVADIVLSHSATKTVDGQQSPLHMTDPGMMGPTSYRDGLAGLLTTTVWPGWRDLVNRYRNFGCSLDELMRELVQQTDQVMTAVGHAEGERECTPDDLRVVLPPAEGQPGADRLIGPAWNGILEVVLGHQLIPGLGEFKDAELPILDAGERELFAMWDKLGISFEPERPDAHPYRVDVREPAAPVPAETGDNPLLAPRPE